MSVVAVRLLLIWPEAHWKTAQHSRSQPRSAGTDSLMQDFFNQTVADSGSRRWFQTGSRPVPDRVPDSRQGRIPASRGFVSVLGTRLRFQTASRRFPDGFQTASRRLPDGFQTASRQLPDGFQTASRRLPDSFQTVSRRLPDRARWVSDRVQSSTGSRWVPGRFQKAYAYYLKQVPDRFRTSAATVPKQVPDKLQRPDGFQTVSRRIALCFSFLQTASRRGSRQVPVGAQTAFRQFQDSFHAASKQVPDKFQTSSRQVPHGFWSSARQVPDQFQTSS